MSDTLTDTSFNFDETCMIFDWDDTLLASSWLSINGLKLDTPIIPPEHAAQLTILERTVRIILERALICGTVIIITNSETGWVELSCSKFIPDILPLLSRIKIISARSTFETISPDDPIEWKIKAFSQEISLVYLDKESTIRKNIISFGDSTYERIALFKKAHDIKALPKSIKFVERPTIQQLQKQLELVGNSFFEICKKTDSLDLMLTIQLFY
jgi:hypothetical protein